MVVLTAFPFYASKSSRLKPILAHLPPTRSFVDVFGGSAAILMNRPRSNIETLNDLNHDITNFFRQLRDHPEDFFAAIKATPYAREEFELALKADDSMPPLERARLFYVRQRQAYGAQGFVPSDWGYARNPIASIGKTWRNAHDKLPNIVDRLQGVQIENQPALKILERYDHKDALFYIDPPYFYDLESGGAHARAGRRMRYERENPRLAMDEDDHVVLLETLKEVEGKVAISGYPSGLYDDLLRGWTRHDFEVASSFKEGDLRTGGVRAKRAECLWVSY